MPIYEFHCDYCGYKEDIMTSVKDRNNPQKCPKCNKQMQRQISSPGFKFIGEGFYETTYKQPKELKKQMLKEKKAREEGKSGYKEI